MDGDQYAPQLSFPLPDDKFLHVNVLSWLGNTMTIPMSYTMALQANNIISVEGIESFNEGTQVYLEDKKDGNMQDMVANPQYQFTSTPQDDPARFVWHFTKSTIGIEEKTAGFQIYSFEDYVYVKNLVKGATYGHVWIYDLTGRTVRVEPADAGTCRDYVGGRGLQARLMAGPLMMGVLCS